MSALARLGDVTARWAKAFIPDPFVIAVLLLAVAFGAGLLLGSSPLALAGALAAGMMEPGLLAFGFQMALILATGSALAGAPAVRGPLRRLAERPTTSGGAAALVASVAMLLGLLNWGFGLVGGAFLAREVGQSFARRGLPLNYPVVGAAAYMGMLVWHGGLSGSAPLRVATAGPFGPAIDVRHTLFSPANLGVTLALLLAVPLFFRALGRSPSPVHPTLQGPGPEPTASVAQGPPTRLERFEHSALLTAVLAVPLGVALGHAAWTRGTGAVTLESVILLFWVLGLVLHRSLRAYAAAFGEAAGGAIGILLQFPIYFGILAVLREAGALPVVAGAFGEVAVAVQDFIPPRISVALTTFASSALVNLFVPSGGGQWALQSPVILQTAQALDLERAPLVMAFSYGDQLTNLLQPFWALPLLAITRLRAGELLGYTLLAMGLAVPVFVLGLLFA
jgi:short-chain fatty acids transporter